jgi:ubiquinone/menaquinone biosynthesis C-methylase UbiE
MAGAFDKEFYKDKSWGAVTIKDAKDLPTLKLSYLMELLRGRKKRTASLLEMGSGSGRILMSIQQRDLSIRLTGVELSRSQVALAKSHSAGIAYVVGDAQRLPFPNSSFDYVIIMDFLEHIERPADAIKEAYRVLKKGGVLYASVPCEDQFLSPYWLSKRIFRRHFKEATAGHIQQFRIRDVERFCTRARFRIAQERYSYHLLGSMMDYTLFTLLLNKRLAKIFWAKNKYYQKPGRQSFASKMLNLLMTIGNAIAYYESKLLARVRFTSTNVHIIARK